MTQRGAMTSKNADMTASMISNMRMPFSFINRDELADLKMLSTIALIQASASVPVTPRNFA